MTRLIGPDPGDGSTGPAIYASVTCFGGDASGAVSRSRSGAVAAGRPVEDLIEIGEEGYAILDASAGSSVLHFRRGPLAAYLTGSGAASEIDLRRTGSALDAAMQRALSGTPAGSPVPGASGLPGPTAGASTSTPGPAPSEAIAPSTSPVVPGLEALLPARVGTTELARQSATGDMVLGTDPGSRAMSAALASLGKQPTDLQIAQAYDESGAVDLSILAFRVPGIPAAQFQPIVLRTWLLADAAGVETTNVKIGAHDVTKVSYGGSGPSSYVLTRDDAVIVIDTADAKLAEQAISTLP